MMRRLGRSGRERAGIVVVAALRRELDWLGPAWPKEKPFFLERWRITPHLAPGGKVWGLESGIGAEAASDALLAFDARFHPAVALSVGLAGGLVQELEVGDVCIAEQQVHWERPEKVLTPPRDLLNLVRREAGSSSSVQWRFGRGFTSAQVIPTPEAKSALAARHGAQWVDMESAAVARIAQRLALPWLAVRAISDTLQHDLNLSLDAILEEGGMLARGKTLGYFLRHPGRMPTALRLSKHAQRASSNLGRALTSLIPPLIGHLKSL